MQSDECNTITATESPPRTIIQPSSGSGRKGQVTTGFTKLLMSGAVLLCLTGITLSSAVLGIILVSILIMMSSPIWVPIATILLISMIGFLWICGLGAALIFGLPWMYKYLRATYPLGSDWVDDVRNQIMGTAGQMRDYAREYFRSKIKGVAPGA
ncbi:hypothetical protein MKX03_006174 [Papaver bracteatum]|nr:hypothetical protein MKX03_006174 [Papaver bracteatum]